MYGRGDLHPFERLFVIGWKNNRDCDITMLLSLKTREVQIKGDQSNKRFRTVQVCKCSIIKWKVLPHYKRQSPKISVFQTSHTLTAKFKMAAKRTGPSCSTAGLRYPPDKSLSSGLSIKEINCIILWKDIYQVDSAIPLLNNWGQIGRFDKVSKFKFKWRCDRRRGAN